MVTISANHLKDLGLLVREANIMAAEVVEGDVVEELPNVILFFA